MKAPIQPVLLSILNVVNVQLVFVIIVFTFVHILNKSDNALIKALLASSVVYSS